MESKYELSAEQIDRITWMLENVIGDALRAAVLEVVGHESKRKNKGRPAAQDKDEVLALKIIAALEAAPAIASEIPAFKGYLAQRTMPKTLLRRRVGNSYTNFDAVLAKMVADQRVMTGKDKGPSGRYLTLFGLP